MIENFGLLPTGEQASLYTISCGELTAKVTDLGATLVNLLVPDRDGQVAERRHLALPERVVGVIKCKNPRCITSVEQVTHEFKLADPTKKIYRCIYCEHQAK